MKILTFDLETTGIPPRQADWKTEYDKFPHILQIGWKFNGEPGKQYLIYQEQRPVPEEATRIHKITTEMANDPLTTLDAGEIYTEFITAAIQADRIMGFNIYFDTSIFKANVIRVFGENSTEITAATVALDKSKRIDLMRLAQKYKQITAGQWIKLQELHFKLFGCSAENCHGALADCETAEKCYFELLNRPIA